MSRRWPKNRYNVQACLPGARIVLFGSHARGDQDGHSDYDLLIVTPKTFTAREKIHWSTLLDRAIDVDTHYTSMIAQHPEISFDLDDIHTISMKIVLSFLYMYNSWRVQYKRKNYDNLDFKEEDFENPSANDIIFDFYRVNYPADWQEKCAVLMGKDLEALKNYFQRRLDFHNGM